MPRAVVYDHDGTLIDSLDAVVWASNRVRQDCGLAPEDRQTIIDGMVWPTAPRMGRLCGESDPRRQVALADAFYDAALSVAGTHTRPYPGLVAVVTGLASRGLPQAMVSNNQGRFVRRVLAAHGLSEFFPVVFGEEDVPAPKPDAAGILRSAQALGLDPADLIYVGDGPADAAASAAAGCRSIGVSWGTHGRSELDPMGFTRVVDDDASLSDAINELLP